MEKCSLSANIIIYNQSEMQFDMYGSLNRALKTTKSQKKLAILVI